MEKRLEYRTLLERFVARQMAGPEFKDELFRLYKADGALERARMLAIDPTYGADLQKRLRDKEITADAFQRLWNDRFLIRADEAELDSAMAHVFTECDAYLDDPTLDVAYKNPHTEESLRAYVAGILFAKRDLFERALV